MVIDKFYMIKKIFIKIIRIKDIFYQLTNHVCNVFFYEHVFLYNNYECYKTHKITY